MLLRALDDATNRVIIVSGTLTDKAVDDEFCDRLARASSRGVNVYIAWGFSGQGFGDQAARVRQMGAQLTRKMESSVTGPGTLRVEYQNTHEKYLVCDAKFSVNGSFNWLGFRGDLQKREKREGSLYTEQQDLIEDVAKIAMENFLARSAS